MVQRKEDQAKYPTLIRAKEVLGKPSLSEGCLKVEPVEVLAYFAREVATSNFAAKTTGPFGEDGLVAVVAALLQSAAANLHGMLALLVSPLPLGFAASFGSSSMYVVIKL